MGIEKVETWNIGMEIAVQTYRLCRLLPPEERHGLSDQMRRAAVSIPSNIAEGYGRESTKEYIQFLSYAKGSLMELKTQILIAERIGYLRKDQLLPIKELCLKETAKLTGQILALSKKNRL